MEKESMGKNQKGKILLFVLCFMCLSVVSASHYIVGYVEGEDVNGKTIYVYNPISGIDINLTDIIGLEGNSNAENTYMIDCESGNIVCDIGVELRVTIDGINYVSLVITGAGFDVAPNLNFSLQDNVSFRPESNIESLECYMDEDCPNDLGSESYCDVNLYRNFTDYSCVQGKCISKTITELVEDCGLSETTKIFYCNRNKLWYDIFTINRGCSNNSCYSKSYLLDSIFYQRCNYGCENGLCLNKVVIQNTKIRGKIR